MKSRQLQMFQIYLSFDPKDHLTFEEILEKDGWADRAITVQRDKDTRTNVLQKQLRVLKAKEEPV